MTPVRRRAARSGRQRAYHHGDLRRALLEEAVRTISRDGVEALTLRAIGATLGVSRTALYRHFSDKATLLAAVGREGFRLFREALTAARQSRPGWRDGFEAMGRAYVRFALEHPGHYRVMFGGFLEACAHDPELAQEANASFQTLVDAVLEGQQAGEIRADAPRTMAIFIWSTVHGVSMLAIDGPLPAAAVDEVVDYTTERLLAGLRAP
jgi:AcrR family transcriptional regulator